MRGVPQFVQREVPHWRQTVVCSALIAVVLILNFTALVARANETTPTSTPVNDVRVLIDISGSMKKNDPDNLRQPALNLFVSLLPTGTQSGVWTFGQWVNMLVPHGPVTEQWKSNARNSVEKINSTGLYTNIEDVIRKSTWGWTDTTPTPGSERSLILLTDGLVDISKDEQNNRASRRRIVQELLPKLQKAEVRIHAIALSSESDSNLLKQLTTATGGRFEVIETSEGLERLFLHLFESVAQTDSLPLTENRVKVDDSIKEMTFLVFRKNTKDESTITSPSGKTYSIDNQADEITWHKESQYDLVTVKNPESGFWEINAEVDPDNRVMVVTDLKLINTKLPATLYVGDKQDFHLHLEDKGNKIDQQDFLHFVRVTLNQSALDKKNKEKTWKLKLLDTGKGADKKAKDGIYSVKLDKSLIPGEHEIEVVVNGTTFRRIYRKQIIIYEDPATASIEHISNNILKLSVFPYQGIIDPDAMRVTAEHKLPNGKIDKVKVSRVNPAEWVHEFSTDEIDGKHEITIMISGNKKDGSPIKATLPVQNITIHEKNSSASKNADSQGENKIINDENPEIEDETFSWGIVTLKVGLFNVIFILSCIGIYKFSPQIRQRLIPNLFEESTNA